MSKPIIGVVLALTPEDHKFKALPAYRFEFLKQHYYEAVEAAGAVAIAIPLTEHHEHIGRYIDIVDGLFIVGGDDVHPELYGEAIDPLCQPQMPRRDNFEVALINAAFKVRKPIFGISISPIWITGTSARASAGASSGTGSGRALVVEVLGAALVEDAGGLEVVSAASAPGWVRSPLHTSTPAATASSPVAAARPIHFRLFTSCLSALLRCTCARTFRIRRSSAV